MRYHVLYGKRGYPMSAWFSDLASARQFAQSFRRVGYSVSIWEHSAEGAREIEVDS